MPARLTVHYDDAPARQLRLDESNTYLLGRDAACDIVIDVSEASRRHASIFCRDGQWQIEDLESKNGVAVGGVAIKTAALVSESWISIGPLLLRFELRSEAQAKADDQDQRRRFETSIALRRSLSPSAGVEPLLRKLLGSTVQLVGLERGFAMVARDDGDMEVICTIGVDGDEATVFRGSVGAINHALETASSVVSMNVQQFLPLADRPSIVSGKIRSLVCLPMSILDRTIGMIYADSQSTSRLLTDLDLEILEGLIGHATTALAAAQLDKEITDINSMLERGGIDLARLNEWQGKLPGYGRPTAEAPNEATGSSSRLTWSRVASGSG